MVRDYFSIILFLHLFIGGTVSGQITNIYDPYFEQALIDFGIDSDGVINGTVATSDISGVTFLDVSGYYIEFLSGIEDFTSLTSLYCHNNLIWTLDLSHNKNLKVLQCSDQFDGLWPQPLSLNVTQNIALEYLLCSNNEMLDLNLSNNINLTSLTCSGNQLTSLDLSKNTMLEYLDCNNNYSSTLNSGILSLDISYLPALSRLNCANNNIAALDTNQNINIVALICSNNQLTSLDINQNLDIEGLQCNNNQLISLDAKQNTKLREVNCSNNLLTYLNVKNDNNSILNVDATGNSSLQCIQVDDEDAANSGEIPYDDWKKDFITIYAEDCEPYYTEIPDSNFEQALIDLGIDKDGIINQSVATSDISDINSLSIDSKDILDLTGIEGFVNLTYLSCSDNPLTSLDLSHNLNLTELHCVGDQIKNLDITQNVNMQILDVFANNLSNLQVTHLPNLEILDCGLNQLQSIDVSQNTNLRILVCDTNQIKSLDVSQNMALTFFLCFDNQLTNLNLKNGTNSNLTLFDATSNPLLTCIQVDDEDTVNAGEAPYDNWYKDTIASYSEDCGYLGIDEVLTRATKLYPNPVTNILTIDSKSPLTKVEIYSMLGKKVKDIHTNFKTISLNNLSNGVYIIKILAENKYTTAKIIKM